MVESWYQGSTTDNHPRSACGFPARPGFCYCGRIELGGVVGCELVLPPIPAMRLYFAAKSGFICKRPTWVIILGAGKSFC